MSIGPEHLWLIPLLPLLAAAVLSVTNSRALASVLSVGSMAVSFILSLLAFARTLSAPGHHFWNFNWLQFGSTQLQLGFLLDPLTASMLLMVTFVGALIFIYSTAYMADDKNYPKFFCYLSLFAAGMLGVIISNSLLLLFICWEIVGLASYLLIGFWYFKPSAALAARKAFITTRIGDVGFFLGMIWLQSASGTLLFYNDGSGCLEPAVLDRLVVKQTFLGVAVTTAIALLIFCGAVGKSGQVPLHVWLPDAMEGPTPVSALIHAATMVAAGVFLVARVYPLMDADPTNIQNSSFALSMVAWVGAITALFAACVAVAQNDIKRILAYSTVSQLGYMMLGLGVGGVFVGMFHLFTHAFFKALLFLGAGSVIHACHGEQDIRKMGGLRGALPLTFATYAIGMMALSGVPILFSGFWSKDEILHAASHWHVSKWPFLFALAGAFLTAFYMTRQMVLVFFGKSRLDSKPHESPPSMTTPLVVLAACAILLGFIGTPAFPWFESYLTGHESHFQFSKLFAPETLGILGLSTAIVFAGIWSGWKLYNQPAAPIADPLAEKFPEAFQTLANRGYIDEFYDATVIQPGSGLAAASDKAEQNFFGRGAGVVALITAAFGWLSRLTDQFVIDLGVKGFCLGLLKGAGFTARLQNGRIQSYFRGIAITLAVLVLLLAWGCKGGAQ